MRYGQGIRGLAKPVAVAVLALQLGACASLGDEPFTFAAANTGAPAQVENPATTTAQSTTASAPANLGSGDGADLTERYPNVVFAVAEDDPFEDFNRAVFHFNDTLDTYVAVPLAETYRAFIPQPARDGIRNAFANLGSPVTWANDVLQGDWERATVTFNRFAINSTLGVGGLHDVAATEFDLQAHYEDFDQTMALAGMTSGPYLVLPLLGPATPRHVVGRVVDSFAHPLTWALAGQSFGARVAPRAVEMASTRSDFLEPLKQLKANSPDYYAAIRSLYRQSRASEIGNGRVVDEQTSLDDDLDLGID